MTKPVQELLPVAGGDVGFLVHRDGSVREAVRNVREVSLKTRRRHDKDATTGSTDCVAVGRPARDEHKGASGSDEDLVAAANLVLAMEDVESLVSSWMPVQGWSDVAGWAISISE